MDGEVGKGYFGRSLVRDLGRAVDSAAHVTALRRTRIGRFDVADAMEADAVDVSRLISIRDALAHLPTVVVSGEHERKARNGNVLVCSEIGVEATGYVLVIADEVPLAIGEATDGMLRMVRGFVLKGS